MATLTIELINLLWPKHNRTSCSDDNLANSYVCYESGASRCNRCLALDNLDMPLDMFKIEATILLPPSHEEIRKRGLKKLTHQERKALGL